MFNNVWQFLRLLVDILKVTFTLLKFLLIEKELTRKGLSRQKFIEHSNIQIQYNVFAIPSLDCV